VSDVPRHGGIKQESIHENAMNTIKIKTVWNCIAWEQIQLDKLELVYG